MMEPRDALPRVPLLLALLVAPWAGSDRTALACHAARAFLAIGLLVWAWRGARDRRLPRIPAAAALCSLLLLAEGAWMGLNGLPPGAGARPWLPGWPGSVNQADSLRALPDLALLLATALWVADAARHRSGRRWIWHALVWSGLCWSAAGLGQKMQQAAWTPNGSGRAPFLTFEYHANAGSYLNLSWPLAAGLFLASLGRPTVGWLRGAMLLAAAVPLAATFVNVSRACTFIALALLVMLAAEVVRRGLRGAFPGIAPRQGLILASALGVLVGAMVFAGGADRMVYRWRLFRAEMVPDHHRLLATRAWTRAVPEAGWLGFGPATFTNVAPRFAGDAGNGWIAAWPYAHMDPLQTVMEWGWVGGGLWAVLVVGAGVAAWRHGGAEGVALRPADQWLRSAATLALVGVLLHSLVDYPLQVFPVQLVATCLVGLLWGLGPADGAGRAAPAQKSHSGA